MFYTILWAYFVFFVSNFKTFLTTRKLFSPKLPGYGPTIHKQELNFALVDTYFTNSRVCARVFIRSKDNTIQYIPASSFRSKTLKRETGNDEPTESGTLIN